jgi:hypothetical protein
MPGAMTNDPVAKLQNGVINLGEQLLRLGSQVSRLEASVNFLKILLLSQLSPDDPLGGLKQFQALDDAVLAADPQDKEQRRVLDVAEAVKEWRKRGKPPLADS